MVHDSGGRFRVGARPRGDEALEEGRELRRLLRSESRERGRDRVASTPVRLLQDRAAGGAQLHHTAAPVVRVDGASDLATLRRFGDESARPRLVDADRLRERTDPHATGRLVTSERVQHPEPSRLGDRLLARVTGATAGTPGSTEAGSEARTAPAPAFVLSAAVSVMPMTAPVLIVMVMTGPTASTAPAEATA